MNSLGSVYQDKADYVKAEQYYQQALTIRGKMLGKNHPDYAGSLTALGSLYSGKEDYAKAELLYRQALKIRGKVLGKNSPSYAISLGSIGVLYRSMGNYLKAEPLYQQALKIRGKVLGKNSLSYATSLNNLGLLYYDMGEYEKAEPLYQQALKIRGKILGKNHPDYANSLLCIAFILVTKGRYLEAVGLLRQQSKIEDRQISQIFSITSDRQRVGYIKNLEYGYSIFMSLVLQQFSKSREQVKAAFEFIMKRKSIIAELLSVERESFLSGKYPRLKHKLRELNKIKKSIGIKTLAGPIKGEDFVTYKQDLAELNSKKEQLEIELIQNIPELKLDRILKRANWRAVARALRKGSALIEFARFNNRNFRAVPFKGDLRWGSPRYVAFVILSKEPNNVQMVDLKDANEIDKMVTNFRTSIVGKDVVRNYSHGRPLVRITPVFWKNIGYDLYKKLFLPLLSFLGDSKSIVIAPDGDLTRLPFEVLPVGKDELIIDKYSVSYVTTARDVLHVRSISTSLSLRPFVAANPDFNLTSDHAAPWHRHISEPDGRQSREMISSRFRFNRLRGTEEEGKSIARLLNVKPIMEQKVLESDMKSFKSPRILHIATHGFFLPNQPYDLNKENDNMIETSMTKQDAASFKRLSAKQDAASFKRLSAKQDAASFKRLSAENLEDPMLRSGLALAGANTWLNRGLLPKKAEDGILTAEDVTGMDLSNTEMVVLSACDTGLGEILRGEGVFGLRRAFMLAGAQTLIMSLWKVPDEQTKELMVDFYEGILCGKTRAEALREAQLNMKLRPQFSHPLYWAAFICQGNSGKLINRYRKSVSKMSNKT